MKKLLTLFFAFCITWGTVSFARAEEVCTEKTLLELSAELVSEEILSELANPDAWLDDRTAAYLESWNFTESAYVQILQTVIWNHPMNRSDEFERLTNEEAYLYKYWMIDGDDGDIKAHFTSKCN